MTRQFDAIVIGLGAMGSLACYQLARRGVRVLGLEQFDIPNARGSSHGASRMLRKIYHEHDDYIALLERTYQLWGELERESGRRLLHLVGGLYMGDPDYEAIQGSIRTAQEHGLAHEVLDRRQIADRFPQFRLPEGCIGVYEPTAGWVPPEQAVCAACHCAMMRGVELHGHEPVLDWQEAHGGGVSVRTPAGTYRADQVLFCGGPWTGELVKGLGVSLWVSRQVTGWVWPRDPQTFVGDRLPCWSFRRRDGTRLYGFPLTVEGPGLKVANHDRSVRADPRTICRDALPGDEGAFREGLRAVLPAADGPLLALRVCMYTNSPDLHAVIGRHPRFPRALVACGFSGHGFKLAPVVGAILADLAVDGRTDLPIEFLGPQRFSRDTGA
jgi:sarcosine oxidase